MTIIEKDIPDQGVSASSFFLRSKFSFEAFYALLLLLLIFLVTANSGFFVVDEVKIKGNLVISKPDIIRESQLEARETIFQIAFQKNRIQRNLKREVRIAAAVISLRFPNQVTITVKERTALCLLEHENNLLVVSNDGIVLGTASGEENNLPIAYGVAFSNAAIGKKISDSNLKKALTIIGEVDKKIQRALSEIDLRNKQLFLDFPGTDHTIIVELGSFADIATKIANLRAILTNTDPNLLEKVDLRVAELPSIIKVNRATGSVFPSPGDR